MHSSVSFSFLLPPGEEHELSQRLLLGENADLSNPQAKLWNMSCNVFSELLACQCLSHVLWHRSNGVGRAAWLWKPGIVKITRQWCLYFPFSLSNVAVVRGLQDLSSPSQGLSPAVEASSPNHWTTTGVPAPLFLQYFLTSVKSMTCLQWQGIQPHSRHLVVAVQKRISKLWSVWSCL